MLEVKKNKIIEWSFIITIFGCSQYLVLTTLAMIFYTGGNSTNPSAQRYDFVRNFFSDLGRADTFLGDSNIVSRILFTIALTIAGISLLFYFISIPFLFTEKKLTKWIAIIGAINGIVTAINYIGIAFTPYDRNLDLHVNFVYTAFTSSISLVIIFSVLFFLNKKIPKYLSWVFVVETIFIILYVILLYGGFGPSVGVIIDAIGQKIVVYSEIICFLIQGIGGLLFIKNLKVKSNSDTIEETSTM
ncbi:MAG: hypothetical protein ACFFDW_10295 [Candidatus Thorarchaeota archaeon]